MKRFSLVVAAVFATTFSAGAPRANAATPWPRTFSAGGATVLVYQPQIKDWNDYTVLDGLAAVAVTTAGATAPIYGVVTFQALTAADVQAGTVTLAETHVTGTTFANEPADVAAKLDGIVRSVPFQDTTVPMASVLASLDGAKILPKSAPIAATPPAIFYSDTRAILLAFDRDPIFAPIGGTGIAFAVNTNWSFLRAGKSYYLLATDHWLVAPAYTGPWSPATAPGSFAKIPDTAAWTDVHAYLHAAALPAADVPHVFVSTKPADLIAVSGSPQLLAIAGTHLDYVGNTGSNLFLDVPAKEWYVLLSGRWYRAASLDGPWSYATATLPADFARIPLNSPRGTVLVSVPGTPESQYVGATMAAPQITTLQTAGAAPLVVAYGGAPQFEPVAGTSLAYAVNTASDVVRVSDTLYYACSRGMWYSSATPNGPWTPAAYVPPAIYTIPASSPLYPDTYVYVYNTQGQPVYVPPPAPPVTIYVGYTAGYAGAYWYNSAWVYGTGYYYPGYYVPGVVPIYYPYAATWTGGAVYTGGSYGSYYNSKTGYYGNQASVYGPYGGATAKSAYNPTTGTYARGAEVYGPNGEAAAGSFDNPRYGVSGSTYQQKTSSGTYGQSNVTTKNGTTSAAHESGANGQAAAVSGPHGSTAVAKSSSTGDVYAGHDGNVYKQSDGTWQKSDGSGGWSNVQTPSDMDRDSDARSAGSGGFGGFRGGGGGFGGGGRR